MTEYIRDLTNSLWAIAWKCQHVHFKKFHMSVSTYAYNLRSLYIYLIYYCYISVFFFSIKQCECAPRKSALYRAHVCSTFRNAHASLSSAFRLYMLDLML